MANRLPPLAGASALRERHTEFALPDGVVEAVSQLVRGRVLNPEIGAAMFLGHAGFLTLAAPRPNTKVQWTFGPVRRTLASTSARPGADCKAFNFRRTS